MAAREASPTASPVHVGVQLINPEDKQLKTVAHSLLESKLEKMLSTAGPTDDPRRTRKQAIDWIKQWDLDGDGIISELEMRGAAIQHAKLQLSYKQRGGWLVALVILAICCFAVILGLSVWANDVSQEAKGQSGQSDLGGFTLRKKDSAAVVKTGTAMYEFVIERIGFLPFDELSQISGIGFVWKRGLHFMSVEGFQWSGSGNVTFFSPRGMTLTVSKPNDTTVTISVQEPGDAAPSLTYQGLESYMAMAASADEGLWALKRGGVELTVTNYFIYSGQYYVGTLPPECILQGMSWMMGGNASSVHETCAVAIMCIFQGFGIVEASVGPQDYFGTEMTKAEAGALTGTASFTTNNLFDPDLDDYKARFTSFIQSRIDVIERS